MVTIKDTNYIKTLKVIIVEGRCPSKSSRSAFHYENKIKKKAKTQFQAVLKNKVGIEIDLFYAGEKKRPDIDNAEKVILDSLKGIAIDDDKQVVKSVKNVHDTTKVIEFENQPILLIDPLLDGIPEYSVIRIHEI